MAFDMGFAFRSTSGYVTDPAYGVPVIAEAYPHTYTNGNGDSINAGFVAGSTIGGANRSTTVDVRLAGINYNFLATGTNSFQVALSSGSNPGAGNYNVDLAVGDINQARTYNTGTGVYDDTSAVISFTGTTGGGGQFFDATGTNRSPGSGAWTGVAASASFATTTCYFKTVAASDIGAFAHFRLTLAGGGPTIVEASFAATGAATAVAAASAIALTSASGAASSTAAATAATVQLVSASALGEATAAASSLIVWAASASGPGDSVAAAIAAAFALTTASAVASSSAEFRGEDAAAPVTVDAMNWIAYHHAPF